MATELRFTVWTSSALDSEVAAVIARTLATAARANGDTEAQVVAVEVNPVEPSDIDALAAEQNRLDIVAALEAEIPDELEDEPIGESGYPAADEGFTDISDDVDAALEAEVDREAPGEYTDLS